MGRGVQRRVGADSFITGNVKDQPRVAEKRS
jgi:hypothetical protein